MNIRKTLVLFLTLASSVALAACAVGAPTTSPQPVTLKIAVLPILDALPMFVAQQNGYFAANGLNVEFVPVASAAERDQIMAAEQADGMINDLVSTLFYNKDAIQIQIVRFARVATAEYPQYRILASAQSGITDVAGLKGVEIGISEGSVIAYTTDRLLEAEGFTADEIKTIAVPKIPDRLSLLGTGELKAANLPDPSASLAVQSGAVVIVDDTKHPEFGSSEISFRKAVIDEHPQAIKGFLAAIEKAVADINADTTKWGALLTDQKLVPAPLIGTYAIPHFPTASVPTEAQFADVLAWAKGKGLIAVDVKYSDSVNATFLP